MTKFDQVNGVDATFDAWSARGVPFTHPPRRSCWDCGAEFPDPDGYLIPLWGQRTIKEK